MKNKKLLFGIFLVFVLLLSTGLTYAWFTINVTGNETANDVRVSTGNLTILYTDGPEIQLLEANPGDSATKTFTVKNNGTLDAYYKINWSAFNNAITKDELSVSFTCKSYSTYIAKDDAGNVESGKCTNMTSESVYNRDLKSNIQISTGITHEYTLTLDFLDINVNQNYNQGQTFTGTLQVQSDTASWASSCTDNNSLRCKIIRDTTPVGDDAASTYVTASTGVNFGAISSTTNGQGLYINNKIGDGDNYYFRGGTYCAYTDYLTEVDAGTKCTTAGGTWSNYTCSYDLSKSACEAAGFTFYEIKNNVSFGGYMWKVIRIDEDGAVRLLYNGTSTIATGVGVQLPNGASQYSSSIVTDNAVVGYMQPIVTTYTESRGVRTNWPSTNSTSVKMSQTYSLNTSTGLIDLTGTIVSGSYTSPYIGYYTCASDTTTTGCAYIVRIDAVDVYNSTNRLNTATLIGGTYTITKAQAESNDVNSKIKTRIDNWYSENLSTYSSKIDTNAGYCNDRRVETLDGGIGNIQTVYNARNRFYDEGNPTYKCNYESNDLFTFTSSQYGNKKLIYPIATITSDELKYAGAAYRSLHSFVHSGFYYWTISPAGTNSIPCLAAMYTNGGIGSDGVGASFGIRPVISLNSTATVGSGDGTLTSPYVIE